MNRSLRLAFSLLDCHLREAPLLHAPQLSDTEWRELFEFAKKHRLEALLYQSLADNGLEAALPASVKSLWQSTALTEIAHYYQMEAFTLELSDLLRGEGLTPILLKGVGLNCLYPSKALRPLSDVDLYLAEPVQFDTTESILVQNGYLRLTPASEAPEHHVNYRRAAAGSARPLLLELHRRIIDTFRVDWLDQAVDRFALAPHRQEVQWNRRTIVTFSPTENLIYLTLHALAHFETSGFGLKVLCDLTVLIRKKHAEIHPDQLADWLNSLGISDFFLGLTLLCVSFLGLEEALCPWLSSLSPQRRQELTAAAELLMEDILAAGEFGSADPTRMMHLARQGVESQPGVFRYFSILKEETAKRFPLVKRVPALLPILALPVLGRYLRNNRTLRKVSVRATVTTHDRRLSIANRFHLFQR